MGRCRRGPRRFAVLQKENNERSSDLPVAMLLLALCCPVDRCAVMWQVTREPKAGAARTGVFLGRLETPAPLLYTRRGQVPHFSPDMLTASLAPGTTKALNLSLGDLYVSPHLPLVFWNVR
jgi:hypothetical protein